MSAGGTHPFACPILGNPLREGLKYPQQIAGPWDADILAIPYQADPARPRAQHAVHLPQCGLLCKPVKALPAQ